MSSSVPWLVPSLDWTSIVKTLFSFEAHHPSKIYFCLGASKLDETFIVDVSWDGYPVVTISAKNIQSFKSYLQVKGQNPGVRAYKISPPF